MDYAPLIMHIFMLKGLYLAIANSRPAMHHKPTNTLNAMDLLDIQTLVHPTHITLTEHAEFQETRAASQDITEFMQGQWRNETRSTNKQQLVLLVC